MQTLTVGAVLPDAQLEDLAAHPVQLTSKIRHKRTVVSFLQPECASCLAQIRQIVNLVSDSAEQQHWILVSSANPRVLEELITVEKLTSPILYDHRGVYAQQIRIISYPFNVVIDDQSRIVSISAGALSDEEVLEVASGS